MEWNGKNGVYGKALSLEISTTHRADFGQMFITKTPLGGEKKIWPLFDECNHQWNILG